MKNGQVWRADLVRALACGESLQLALAEDLGFERAEPPLTASRPTGHASKSPAALTTAPSLESERQRVVFQPTPVPFWRAESLSAHVSEREVGEDDGPDTDVRAEPRADDAALTFEPLAPIADILTRLRRRTEMQRWGREVDVERLVDEFSRGRQLDSIPRRRHRAWGAGLHVITDLSRRLIPYRVDQGVLCRTLQRVLSKTDATFASLRDNDLLPQTYCRTIHLCCS